MKVILWTGGLLWLAVAHGADLMLFEASVRTQPDFIAVEVIQARNAAAATDLLEGRYPNGKITALRPLASQTGYEWHLAKLSVDGANVADTALAKGSGEARRVFASRYAEGRIVSLTTLADTSGYSLFESTIHGTERNVFRDVVFAKGIANARKVLNSRHPGARISSISALKPDSPR